MLHYTVHSFFLWRSTPHPFCLFSVWWWATGLILSYLQQCKTHSKTEHNKWVASTAALYPVVPGSNIDPKTGYRQMVSWSPLKHISYITLNIPRKLTYTSFKIYYRKLRSSGQHFRFVFLEDLGSNFCQKVDYRKGLRCFT
jgi:hypothetical protein